VAFTGNYTCNSFKSGLLSGDFDFDTPGDTIKMALYTNAATLDEDTAIYTTDGEVLSLGVTQQVALLLQSRKVLPTTPPSLVLQTPQSLSLPLLLRGGR
jgi:hypothetical protein